MQFGKGYLSNFKALAENSDSSPLIQTSVSVMKDRCQPEVEQAGVREALSEVFVYGAAVQACVAGGLL